MNGMNPLDFLRRFVIRAGVARRPDKGMRRSALLVITLAAAAVPGMSVASPEPLGSTVIDGSSSYGFAQLFELYKDHLGLPVTGQTAAEIAAAVQQRYLADGYSRPGYTIHDRGLRSGIIRIQLIEPRISHVDLSGAAGPHRRQLEDLFGQLSSGQTLRPGEVTDALREARRLPGLDVDVSVEPDASRSGAYTLEVESTFKPVEGSIKLSNRGTEEIGRSLLFAQLRANGFPGRMSSTGLFATTAEDSGTYSGGGLFHRAAIGHDGATTRLQFAVTSLAIDSDGVLVEQDRERWLFKYVQPVARRQNRELAFSAGFESDDLDVRHDGADNRQDRLRSLNVGLSVNWRSPDRFNLFGVELEQGMNGLGSSVNDFSQADDPRESDFTIWRFHYARTARLADAWTWRLNGYAQYSTDVLPSIKQFKVGGNRIGRGFEAAAVSGDRGLGGKVELRRSTGQGPSWIGSGNLYAFYDLGGAWRNDESGRESAASTGVGVSAEGERLTGYLEVAKPLTHPDADGHRDAEVFAEVAYRF